MRNRVALSIGVMLLPLVANAQSVTDNINPGDWPRYTRDYDGTRFSPLTQINTSNVDKLTTAWSIRVRPNGGGAIVSSATPIVVGGLMYYPVGDAVLALEPETGKEIWRHPVTGGAARRAVSYWPGDKDHTARIYYSTGTKIWALNARTGEVDPGFGTGGVITLDVAYGYPPTIYKNVLVVGASTQELIVGEPGDSRGFDAVTGKKLWQFHTVPQPGEPGHETWLNDGWKGRSGSTRATTAPRPSGRSSA